VSLTSQCLEVRGTWNLCAESVDSNGCKEENCSVSDVDAEVIGTMSIAVVSPIKLVAEGLNVLLEHYGYRVNNPINHETSLVLVDLIHTEAPYPQPCPIPTIALINNDPQKAQALMAMGYFACFDAKQKGQSLQQVIETLRLSQCFSVIT
jgi:hypothetical protein